MTPNPDNRMSGEKNMKKPQYYDDSRTIRTVSNLETRGTPKDGTYMTGEVLTRHGIVQAYAQDTYSNLRFCFNGRLFTRNYPRRYSELGLCRLAAKFAKEKSK